MYGTVCAAAEGLNTNTSTWGCQKVIGRRSEPLVFIHNTAHLIAYGLFFFGRASRMLLLGKKSVVTYMKLFLAFTSF